MPGLEVDGKMLAQSCTIFRFLARRHGLAGKDEWEQSLAEMYGDCISDLRIGWRHFHSQKVFIFFKYF